MTKEEVITTVFRWYRKLLFDLIFSSFSIYPRDRSSQLVWIADRFVFAVTERFPEASEEHIKEYIGACTDRLTKAFNDELGQLKGEPATSFSPYTV